MAQHSETSESRLRDALLSAALFVATAALFWPATGFKFLGWDDGAYVWQNPQVQSGLSGAAVNWALTSTEHDNWHPLTWLSLQCDYEIGGLDPRTFHRTNVLLHALGAALLFWALRLLTGAAFCSALLAALFAWHPLHVESVAWIAERKDVLSGVFWMLTMIAYACYARRPGFGRYLAFLLSFALGLAAKSMLVTLPCVLLLLDFWPLRRLPSIRTNQRLAEGEGSANRRAAKRRQVAGAIDGSADAAGRFSPARPLELILEKVPLLALSAVACWLTLTAQHDGGAVESVAQLPLGARLENAVTSYVAYLGKMFWPARLAAYYPHAGQTLPVWQTVSAAAALLAISGAAFVSIRRRPHLSVGWLWYLGTLVPVIGIIQVGQQSMADRYTYIPLIGIWIALAWQAESVVSRLRSPKLIAGALTTVCLAACLLAARRQLAYWRSDRELWEHATAVTENNYFAEGVLAQGCLGTGEAAAAEDHARNALRVHPTASVHVVLGILEMRRGRLPEAEHHCREAIRLAPGTAEAYNNLGSVYVQGGRLDDAFKCFVAATNRRTAFPSAYDNAGVALLEQGKLADAVPWFSASLALDPNFATAYENRGDALFYQRQWHAAIDDYRRAVRLQPQAAMHRCKLAAACREAGDAAEARRQYELAFKLDPDWPDRAAKQAWRRATEPGMAELLPEMTLQLARQACEATEPNTPPKYLDALAAAYANAGQFEQAAATLRRAIEALAGSEDRDRAEQYRQRLACYESRRPFRSLASASPTFSSDTP